MHYLVGDLQGCCDPLDRLLAEIGFSPSRDHVHLLGDLVNRGPQSLRTLRRLRGLGASATCLLGNHDLHLIAVAAGIRPLKPEDTIGEILNAPDRESWLDWLRHGRLADQAQGWLMVHAGVAPQWEAADALMLAAEVEALLRGPDRMLLLRGMYGNEPCRWSDELEGAGRWRFVVNALTRMRFCSADGRVDLKAKGGLNNPPPGLLPWFDVPGRLSADTPIAFGHWSTLGLVQRPNLLALDTGCVWGGALTAVRVDGGRREVHQVRCAQAQAPGGDDAQVERSA